VNVGVLTGGGDVPGLNPAIRGVARRCFQHGFKVTGILDGWRGLIEADTIELTPEKVSGILHIGGTILGSSRTNPFKKEADLQKALANVKALGLDAVVAIGGDDTMGVALRLYKEHGFPGVGVPKTMDNDVGETEFCIGFDTSIGIVTDAIDRLHSTAASHHRILVVEVMGRHAGWVAVYGGMAGGADYIGIPEVPVEVSDIEAVVNKRKALGKPFSIIVVAEGAEIHGMKDDVAERDAFGHVILAKRAVGQSLAEQIEKLTGTETRAVQLGHIQRGGTPSPMDRVLGLRLGVRAADLVKEGKYGYMPALKASQIVDVPLEQALARNRTVDLGLYETAKVFF
jgi:ATP-dependent phosphofructokinase / diphosphate-dependent phosphofructokinase